MTVTKRTAPSSWASYLINGDASGIEDSDKREADAWIAGEALGMPVSCEDAGFMRGHDAMWACHYAADCQEYTFLAARHGAPEYWLDGTSSGIEMRAADKGRSDSLIAMVQGDRRDAAIMDAAVGTPAVKRVRASLAAVDRRLEKEHGKVTFDLYWAPEGRKIATVAAVDALAAIRKAPMPYRKYLGEIYAQKVQS